MRRVFIALAIAAMGAFCVAAPDLYAQGKGKSGKSAMRISVEKVVKAPVSQTMPVIGRFVARQHGTSSPRRSKGRSPRCPWTPGDRVTKGQVVARLVLDRLRSNRDLKAAQLKEKQAALRAAEAQYQLASGELARLEKLRRSAAFSMARLNDKENEVLKYESQVAEAQASVGQAEANLGLAEIDLRDAEIRAPYNGVVVQRHVVPGNYVDVGDKIVTLINDDALEIEADVPSDNLSGLQVGRSVSVRLDDGSVHKAMIRAVIPAENAMTRTRPVRFVPAINGAAPAAGLAADQSVTVNIPMMQEVAVLTVHKDAVVSRAGSDFVFVVENDKVSKRTVKLGRALGERFEVLSGLKHGELVAVKGNERLRPGQKVKYSEPKATSGKAPGTGKSKAGQAG